MHLVLSLVPSHLAQVDKTNLSIITNTQAHSLVGNVWVCCTVIVITLCHWNGSITQLYCTTQSTHHHKYMQPHSYTHLVSSPIACAPADHAKPVNCNWKSLLTSTPHKILRHPMMHKYTSYEDNFNVSELLTYHTNYLTIVS